MTQSIYRKKSMDRIASPEQLNDYLRVTNPTIWVVLAAIILLLAGMLVWGAFASIDSYAAGTAEVKSGSMTIVFDDPALAENVEAGMAVTVGELTATLTSVGRDADGDVIASASTDLADGSYPVRVSYRQTQVLELLFN